MRSQEDIMERKYDCYDECSRCGRTAALFFDEGLGDLLVCAKCLPTPEHLGLAGEVLQMELAQQTVKLGTPEWVRPSTYWAKLAEE